MTVRLPMTKRRATGAESSGAAQPAAAATGSGSKFLDQGQDQDPDQDQDQDRNQDQGQDQDPDQDPDPDQDQDQRQDRKHDQHQDQIMTMELAVKAWPHA